jgi:hypothetical protein
VTDSHTNKARHLGTPHSSGLKKSSLIIKSREVLTLKKSISCFPKRKKRGEKKKNETRRGKKGGHISTKSDTSIGSFPVNNGGIDLGCKDVFNGYNHDVLGQDSKIRPFTNFEGSKNILREGRISRINGHSYQHNYEYGTSQRMEQVLPFSASQRVNLCSGNLERIQNGIPTRP